MSTCEVFIPVLLDYQAVTKVSVLPHLPWGLRPLYTEAFKEHKHSLKRHIIFWANNRVTWTLAAVVTANVFLHPRSWLSCTGQGSKWCFQSSFPLCPGVVTL